MTRAKSAILALLLALAVAPAALAQGPLQQKVHYTITTQHALRMGDYMLPAGTYVLQQVNVTDLNRFALYRGDMDDEPIAIIHTTRVDYKTGEYREKAGIALTIDEGRAGAPPMLRGWVVPGEDGWQVLSVDADDDILVRAQ